MTKTLGKTIKDLATTAEHLETQSILLHKMVEFLEEMTPVFNHFGVTPHKVASDFHSARFTIQEFKFGLKVEFLPEDKFRMSVNLPNGKFSAEMLDFETTLSETARLVQAYKNNFIVEDALGLNWFTADKF
jgi:hypothetical protein